MEAFVQKCGKNSKILENETNLQRRNMLQRRAPSKKVCRYFIRGQCTWGDSCRFIHSTNAPSRRFCPYFAEGRCTWGNLCRFRHLNDLPNTALSQMQEAPSVESAWSMGLKTAQEIIKEETIEGNIKRSATQSTDLEHEVRSSDSPAEKDSWRDTLSGSPETEYQPLSLERCKEIAEITGIYQCYSYENQISPRRSI